MSVSNDYDNHTNEINSNKTEHCIVIKPADIVNRQVHIKQRCTKMSSVGTNMRLCLLYIWQITTQIAVSNQKVKIHVQIVSVSSLYVMKQVECSRNGMTVTCCCLNVR